MGRRFRVRSPHVVDDTIEGEVIVIDLESGTYYSLRSTAADIWHRIKEGAGEAAIGDSLARRYTATSDEISSGVARLLDELAAERLIEETAEEPTPTELPSLAPAPDGRTPFVAPVLEKHTDMQDLILLDPVHDVTEAGWPYAASARDET
jgi:Coenzyme PQQ synthesis protein D (PqqD)